MELLDVRRSVLVVIDVQGKLVEMVDRPRATLATTLRLVKLAGLFGVPVVLTEQYPKGLGPTHPEVRAAFDALSGPKAYVDKTSFGCCGDPGFERALDEVLPAVAPAERQLVVAGIEAHVCVMQTVLPLLRTVPGVFVVWDAVSSRGEEYRRYALDRMARSGAVLTNHESVAFEWMRDKNDPRFKAVSALLKEGQPAG